MDRLLDCGVLRGHKPSEMEERQLLIERYLACASLHVYDIHEIERGQYVDGILELAAFDRVALSRSALQSQHGRKRL